MLESTRSCSSVDTAFYAIKWAHEIAGMASPTDNQLVSRVWEAAKKILGAGRPNRKEPLSLEVLKDIVEGTDLSNILQLRNVCLYVLADGKVSQLRMIISRTTSLWNFRSFSRFIKPSTFSSRL